MLRPLSLKAEILKEHSKNQTLKIVRYIDNDEQRFDELMNLFFNSENKIAQRASWVASYCTEANPNLIKSYLNKMIQNLERKNIHNAVKRNTIRILQFIEIPEKLLGSIVNKCFDYLNSKNTSIAIKVFSMSVLENISKKEPELKKELKLVIESQLEYSSAGYKARAKKVLKNLSV